MKKQQEVSKEGQQKTNQKMEDQQKTNEITRKKSFKVQ